MKKALLSLLAIMALGIGSIYAQCSLSEVEVTVDILTDTYGYETYWTLSDDNGNVLLEGGQGGTYANGTAYSASVCVD